MEVWYKRYGMKRFVAVLMVTVAVSTIFTASAFSEVINLTDLPYGHFYYDQPINPPETGERVYRPYNICFDYLITLAHSRGNHYTLTPGYYYYVADSYEPQGLKVKDLWTKSVPGYDKKNPPVIFEGDEELLKELSDKHGVVSDIIPSQISCDYWGGI